MTGGGRHLGLFFVLTFAITWGVGGLWLLFPKPLNALLGPFVYGSPAYLVAACAPSLVGLGLTLAEQGRAGLLDLLRRLLPGTALTMAVAVLVLPTLALALCLAMPTTWPVKPAAVLIATPLLLLTTAQVITNAGPLGEEFGWRGYALPRLLERWPPLAAGTILGLVWTLWHVPAFLFSDIVLTPLTDIGWYALGTIALSVLMTWLHVHGRGSLLVAGLIPHAVINAMGATGAWATRPAEAVALAIFSLALFHFWPPMPKDQERA
ncbi:MULTISPECIES: type II CAAX endopeptidase family protein [unclassified Caulobacter]|uniref:type II CAAX endopeptidase family protein n=1 Tax=unclassified Caulobacter TaxID=2648921 RepID=UPI0007849E94|nr:MULTISPECIES: type II CAAX endopeptidase family protein [unclassified Caulobacter]AZS19672.1 CPBP family intramembrane metalloprotease [Caulobacter sp. FWC26]